MSIQASDLRIGNWVMDDDGKVSKIEALWSKEWKEFDGSDPELFGLRINNDIGWLSDHLSGIPLTPEILEKCGFNKVNRSSTTRGWQDKNIHLREMSDGKIVLQAGYKKINVVSLHQLQNLYFCLTGSELEVNI